MGLTDGFIMSSSVLADLVLIINGKTVRKTGCDPSGTVPDNEACTPDAVGVGASPLSTQRSQGSTRRGSTVFPKYVVDASSEDGIKSPPVKGSAKFLDVTIAYPELMENEGPSVKSWRRRLPEQGLYKSTCFIKRHAVSHRFGVNRCILRAREWRVVLDLRVVLVSHDEEVVEDRRESLSSDCEIAASYDHTMIHPIGEARN